MISLKLRPGVNVEATQTLNESGISSCNLIRFKSSLPQKLGGWTKFYPNSLPGIPRDLHAWGDLSGNHRLSVGTTTNLDVITNGLLVDITPQTKATDGAPNFSTVINTSTVTVVDANISNVTAFDAVFFNTPVSVGGIILAGIYPIATIVGTHSYQIIANSVATATVNNGGVVPIFDTTTSSPIVQVTLPAHGLVVGNEFTFPIVTNVGGLMILGTYAAQSVPTVNTFTISASIGATSTATVSMNGGNAELLYYINLGPPAPGAGYGLGGYGLGGYGTGVVPSSQTGTPITTTNWSQDNWGEILLACPRGGGVYYWPPNSGHVNAFLVPTAPTFNGGIFVAMPEQILVCWGSTSAAPGFIGFSASPEQRDPLIVRWSDIEDFTNFTASSATQAGSFRIPTGSEIRSGIQGPQQALIWTDIELWSMQYLGYPLVFGFNKLSSGCGLIAQHAVAVMRGLVAWMSQGSFFLLSGGGVQELPCPVWDAVFQDLDTNNLDKITAAANSQFSEFTWYYPSISGGTGEPDKYVKVNISEGFVWDYGNLSRTAWTDQSVLGQAIGSTPQGVIYQHETSNDADGQPMNPWFQTGWFVIAEGQQFSFVDWFFPDMKWGFFNGVQTGQVLVTIYATDYPNGPVRTKGPYTMSQAVTYVNTRLRGRQVALRFESNDLGSWWRLGQMRYRTASDGRR